MVVRKRTMAQAKDGRAGSTDPSQLVRGGSAFSLHFSPDTHVGTGLRETYRRFADNVSKNLSGLNLSLNMWFVLRALWETDGMTQVDLAARLALTPAAMVGLVNSLEAAGLVKRRRSTSDGRAFCVFLTAAGRRVRTKATELALKVDTRALRGFSVAEIGSLLSYLGRLRTNLDASH